MTQITGDDHPTYEDSVKESLKEIAEKTMNKYSNTLQKLSDKPLDLVLTWKIESWKCHR